MFKMREMFMYTSTSYFHFQSVNSAPDIKQIHVLATLYLQDADQSGAQDRVIVVGAASKGIIKRDQQHNAMVYKSTYASNPFDNMSADEIEAYKAEVERKAGGGTGTGTFTQATAN